MRALVLTTCLLLTHFAHAEKPRVAVVFEEQVRGVFGLSGNWMDPGRGEETVVAALKDAGFIVVDSQQLRANLLREQAVQVLAGDQKAAIAAGSRLQAPYVIVGKGYAKSSGQIVGSSMKSVQANVQLTLLNAENGEVLASTTATAAKPHMDEVIGGGEALAAASTDAAQKLIAEMDGLQAGTPGGGTLAVSISGLKSYRHFLFVKEWIEKNIPDMRKIEKESYTAGSANLELASSTKGSDFAEKIATAKFDGFAVNPIDVSDHSVLLKVILRE